MGAFRQALRGWMEPLRQLVLDPVQTNEVGRCGPLLGGFLLVAHRTDLPLRLLEIGASAGLNLNWDHYRYTWPGGAWGNSSSPLVLQDVFTGERLPPLPAVTVLERAGCDPRPLDPTSQDGRLALQSFIWADQVERMHILDQAIAIARTYPVRVERVGALEWLRSRLANPAAGAATVLFHSVVWQYIRPEEKKAVLELVEAVGAGASSNSPFAWLRMEPGKEGAEVRLKIFPGFEDQLIATAGYHKPQTAWIAECE